MSKVAAETRKNSLIRRSPANPAPQGDGVRRHGPEADMRERGKYDPPQSRQLPRLYAIAVQGALYYEPIHKLHRPDHRYEAPQNDGLGLQFRPDFLQPSSPTRGIIRLRPSVGRLSVARMPPAGLSTQKLIGVYASTERGSAST